jgi:hypothetical protein
MTLSHLELLQWLDVLQLNLPVSVVEAVKDLVKYQNISGVEFDAILDQNMLFFELYQSLGDDVTPAQCNLIRKLWHVDFLSKKKTNQTKATSGESFKESSLTIAKGEKVVILHNEIESFLETPSL